MTRPRPNILFVMTDQQRFDTVRLLGNPHIYTPNLDRLAQRAIVFSNAYSPCPVCVPARYTIRTGRDCPTTCYYDNGGSPVPEELPPGMEERCGPYLARVLGGLGYRTFGIGKFHASPWDEDLGYEVHLRSEELYATPDQRARDAYASWISREHPEYDWIEMLMGERTEMYYMPQVSPLPAELTVERWAADRAVEQIRRTDDDRPFFGLISFIGPHPPFAPPIPYNRIYDPDRMPSPERGDPAVDHMDEQIPWMNHAIWAEEISDARARVLKARYYGEITYIDDCVGRILDAVNSRPDAEDTLVCFFSDHGDHLGDHHAWQKESFFEASCRVPMLLSWPARFPQPGVRDELVALTDLFGLATSAAGAPELRDGIDLLGMIEDRTSPRGILIGRYGTPGTLRFKVMVRTPRWKYVFLANGGREQLFDVLSDPHERVNRASGEEGIVSMLRRHAVESCLSPGIREALDGDELKVFPFQRLPRERIYQFDASRGVFGFPGEPSEGLGPAETGRSPKAGAG